MRVYELAETLDVSTDDLIDALEDEFAYDPGSHMSSVEQDMIPDVMEIWSKGKLHKNGTKKVKLPRSLFRLKVGDVINLSIDKKSLETTYDQVKDQFQFWLGLAVLATAEDRAREHQAIRKIGKDYLNQVDQNTEESIKQLNESSDQLVDRFSGLVVDGIEFGLNSFEEVSSRVEDWTRETINRTTEELKKLRPRLSFNVEFGWK